MNHLFDTLVPAIGWSLLHFIWQGLLVGWAAALALHLLRNARPQARYAVACAALLLCAALPVGSIAWRVQEALQAGYSIPVPLDPLLGAVGAGAIPTAHVPALVDADQLTSFEYLLRRQLPWLVLLWAAGAALMTLRLSLGLQWVRQRTVAGHYRPDPEWQQRLERLALRIDVKRPVRLGVSGEDLEGPMTAGCWRPIVLLPAALVTGMPPHLLEALLAHELAHIRRHDYLVNLVQSAIEILLFYHPSVWMLSKRIRIEREQVADDLAASALGEPRRLALALSELDKFQFSTSHFAPAAHGGDLMSRIKRLIHPDAQPLSWKIAAPLLGLCTACVMLYAHAQPDASARPAAQPDIVVSGGDAARAAAGEAAETAAAAASAAAAAQEAAEAAKVAAAAGAGAAQAAAEAARAAALHGPGADVPVPPAPPAPPAAPKAPSHALPAPPAPPAPPPLPRGLKDGAHIVHPGRSLESYAIVRAGDAPTRVAALDTRDLHDLQCVKEGYKGDFIWFKKDGKSYVVKDSALVAKVREAWAPSEKLGAEMEKQGAAMDGHGKRMEALGEEISAHVAAVFNEEVTRNVDRRLAALARTQERLGSTLGELGERMASADSDARREALSRQMAAVQKQMEPVQQQMSRLTETMAREHAKVDVNREPMKSLHARMAELSKPMEEYGRRMGELGREQGRLSQEADRTTRKLIEEALRKGQAAELGSGRG
ncbi:M56 family metallopeptidase [Massilia sp. METH4]|uniref:M56 family metallopeptidase n=1 Tax=Massilia sp. METH4 TaxID=3123041 RepID=UPI0030D62B06